MKDSKKIITVFILMLCMTFLVFGASYAFLSYAKEGTKSVTMTSGSVKLHYEESSLKSINLTNALPMDDTRGKAQTDYFEFTITSETAGYDIPYYVASRVTTNEEDQIPASYISLYLTEVVNNSEQEVLDTTYDTLTNISKNNHIEQQLMNNTVLANTANYEKTYRLRMWINETADYSPVEENGVQTYPMQDKELEFIVNVYTEVEEYVVSTGIEPNDRYCFDTECFRVVNSTYNGDTILIAEEGLDFEMDDYCEATMLQTPNRTWYGNGLPYCPDNGTDYMGSYDKDISELYSISAIEDEIGPGKTYDGDFDPETATPYPYVYNPNNNNLLKTYADTLKESYYNLPSNAEIRLPSKEEMELINSIPALSNYSTGITGSVGIIDGEEGYYPFESYYGSIYPTDFIFSEIRPVLTMSTADLQQFSKTTDFLNRNMITYNATKIENKFGISINNLGINYNIVDGIENLYAKSLIVYSNIAYSKEQYVYEFKKILNYIKNNLSDDNKLYYDYNYNNEIDIDNYDYEEASTWADVGFDGYYKKNGLNYRIILSDYSEHRFIGTTFSSTYIIEIR